MPASIDIFPGDGPRHPRAILEAATQAGLAEVVVVGWGPDGDLFLSASSVKVKDMAWLLWNADSELRDHMNRVSEDD